MPTKLGKGGAGQQNYVPAGNEAGGQYGDNESGSNKHFKAFKKPIQYNPKRSYSDEELKDIIKYHMNMLNYSNNVKRVINILNGDNLDPQIKNLVLDTIYYNKISLVAKKDGKGLYSNSTKTIYIASIGENIGRIPNGETLFHEAGHALDYTYGDNKLYSRDYVSQKYNKTMFEMKNEELTPEVCEKIIEEFKQEKADQQYKINGIKAERDLIASEIEQIVANKYNALNKNQEWVNLKKQKDELYSLYIDDKISPNEFRTKNIALLEKINNIEKNINYEGKENYQILSEKRDKLFYEQFNKQKEYDDLLFRKYCDLSDICQSIDEKYKFWGGHDYGYFDIGNHKYTEVFAEIQSALGTNKDSLSMLEKYIPKTIEIYKEIIGGLNNGK